MEAEHLPQIKKALLNSWSLKSSSKWSSDTNDSQYNY